MDNIIEFQAQIKSGNGKSVSKQYRQQGLVPAIIYGGPNQGTMVGLPFNELLKKCRSGNLYSKLAKVVIEDKPIMAIIRSVQMHPVTDVPQHIDLHEVAEDQLVKVEVPLRVTGEDKCAAIKRGGVLNLPSRSLNLMCYPRAIPKFIEVDVAELAINHSVHVNDLNLPEGARPFSRTNFVVLSISGKAEEKEENTENKAA